MFSCVGRELIERLENAGFRTNLGIENAGLILLARETGGGYYIGIPLPTLALHVVIDWDAKIRELANGTSRSNRVPSISHFTSTGLAFVDGTSLDADVGVFCTGYLLLLPSPYARCELEIPDRFCAWNSRRGSCEKGRPDLGT
jgi:hypothetical protein